MKLKENDRLTIKGTLSFAIYFIVMQCLSVPFILLGIDVNNISPILQSLYIILVELVIIIAIINMYKYYLLKCLTDIKINKNKYFKKYLKYWFVILIGTSLLNLIIMSLNGGEMAGNEETVRETLGNMPVYTWISAVLLAPVIEELAFRLSFKSIFKKKWIFIILSGFTFGLFHLVGHVTTFYDILYILPYSLPGCIFAYILWDTDNIFVPISMHFLHNGILMSLQIFMLLFGVI